MISNNTIATIRFGYGPVQLQAPQSAQTLLDSLADNNKVAQIYPSPSTQSIILQLKRYQIARKAAETEKEEKAARREISQTGALALLHGNARILDTDAPFLERLNWFWADHFTAVGKNLTSRAFAPAYLDEAIRPHVTGNFSEMLKAVATHPFMLNYLDQAKSVGPNSRIGQRRNRGLNENLAREMLELHTLGVGDAYDQRDVRQLAELLTGLSISPKTGFVFNGRQSEPGEKIILGKVYGGVSPDLNDIFAALDDLALHPATARHLARKLAVHFVSDVPDSGLVEHMAATYLANNADLNALYQAMLEHPAAWGPLGQKAKQPFDFLVSALVALQVSGAELLALDDKEKRNLLYKPLLAMGQPFMQARGPDGWPEAADNWITPQGLAVRIAWALRISKLVGDRVSEPVEFLQSTLADAAGPKLSWAVKQVDTVQDGVGLIFASAEFNRR